MIVVKESMVILCMFDESNMMVAVDSPRERKLTGFDIPSTMPPPHYLFTRILPHTPYAQAHSEDNGSAKRW